MSKKLSIVIPCYNEQETITPYFTATDPVLKSMPVQYEYWFVDDGSADSTLHELKSLQYQHPDAVHYISFSRNFGKESALYAGLKATTGDYVVVMDADLQDPPSYLPQMLELITNEDYDCIGTRRTDRTGEAHIKSWLSDRFYDVINRISKTEIVSGARDYRMMTRQMVDAVLSMTEYNRFSKGIFSWVGFKTKYLEYSNVQRVAGTSDWSTWKLAKYAIDGIIDFSDVPLSISMWIGGLSAVLSLIGLVTVIIRRLINPASSIAGWASLVCVILLIGGIQLICLGIVGKYIGKIYLQSKHRPIYIIREKQ